MLQTVCFPIENVVLGIQQLRNMYTEIIENGCQGKLQYANKLENCINMMAKWEPQSMQH